MKKKENEENKKIERKLSSMSSSGKRISLGEDSNLKLFNKFLNDYGKKETEIENNSTDYFKLFPLKNDK